MSIQVSEETVERLSDSVNAGAHALDTGRRVGWAKAFEAMRRADSAERDVNMLRDDNRILSAFAARAYGALVETVGTERIAALFRGDHHEMKGYFPQGPLNAGRDSMRRLLGIKRDELNAIRAHIAAAKDERRELQPEVDRRWVAAKQAVREDLKQQFGIPSDGEFFRWLGQYQKGSAA